MSDFSDLVARAVSPSMTRPEREEVYGVVKQALRRLQDRDGLSVNDPRTALQQHIVEETIRDVELRIARVVSMEKLERAFALQNAGTEAEAGGEG